MKKNTPIIFLVFFIYVIPTYTQTSDSINIVKEINKIEAEIKKVYQNVIIQNEKTEKISKDVNAYYENQLEELTKLQTLLEKNSEEFKNMNQVLAEIDTASSKNIQKIKNFEIRNFIVQFILFGLLAFLTVFVIRFRRQSLDYLLTKANNLANQNDKIIEKAEELKSIKMSLNELIIEQRKKESEEKKSKRKKKNKK